MVLPRLHQNVLVPGAHFRQVKGILLVPIRLRVCQRGFKAQKIPVPHEEEKHHDIESVNDRRHSETDEPGQFPVGLVRLEPQDSHVHKYYLFPCPHRFHQFWSFGIIYTVVGQILSYPDIYPIFPDWIRSSVKS